MSRRIALPGAVAIAFAALLASCDKPPLSSPTASTESAREPTPGLPWFEDTTTAAGIDFFQYDSVTPLQTILETMGGGVGWIDYDGDGWLDLFCVQDGPLRPTNHVGPLPTHKFYRNNGNGTFTDVTERVGLNKSGYGLGLAVGDFNNDGYDDLVVTYYRGVALFENRPDGNGGRRFVDVTKAAKIDDPHWATSCGWGDIDGDGLLDLYVCNYVEVNLEDYKPCVNQQVGANFICPPTIFPKTAHRLYRNNGDGTFADVTQSSGISSAPPGGGLAVILLDLDGDGKTDIYVANDLGQAYLFQNRGGGKFTDRGMLSGAVIDANGRFMAGMGIAVGDLDGSHRPSLIVTNYQDEPDMVFLNQGKMRFREWSHPSGIGPATIRRLAFGIDLLDANLDGNLDVAIANGHVYRNAPNIYGYPQGQEQQLFLGDGTGRFRDVSDTAGPYFREQRIGRGLAVCDYDNDGLPDLIFGNNSGPAKLLRNATRTDNHWLRLDLVGDGKTSNRNAVGARVEVEAGGRKLVRWIHGGGSYLSASDRRLLIGLGAARRAENVTVIWPSGARQEFRDLEADHGWRLTQGQPRPAPLPGGTGRNGGIR